jgi:TetR/AcrR family transcriptional repressor of nem operon
MRYVKGHGLHTRNRIVEEASYGLRQAGANGISVSDLMKLAGLTHGGFYAYFESREALIIEAFAAAMDRTISQWRNHTNGMPAEERFSALVAIYLRSGHRDDRARGCVLPALGTDIARSSPKARRAFCRQARRNDWRDRRVIAGKITEAGAPDRHRCACNHDGLDRTRACGR